MAAPLLRSVAPDRLNRKVLFAVELVDPLTRVLTHDGVRVDAAGLRGRPIMSHSGRFVWLEEGTAWPGAITIDPGRLPFERHVEPAPPRPADLETATPA